MHYHNSHIPSKGTEITFEQFKTHVLQNQKTMETKKIIGYRLIKSEYKKASEKIMDTVYALNSDEVTVPSCIDSLRNAGVLDIWFEPIYKEEKSFKVGDWVYAEEQEDDDWRSSEYIPIFQVKQIFNNEYLRPVDGSGSGGSGILAKYCRLATTEEKNNALIAEAKKRYPVGTRINCLEGYGKNKVTTHDGLDFIGEKLWIKTDNSGGSLVCWKNGNWAEIGFSEPEITIKDYTAKFTKDYVIFGCQEYSKDFVLTLHSMLENNDFEFEYREEVKTMADWFNSQS